MDSASQIHETSTDSKPLRAGATKIKHVMIALAVPLAILLIGFSLLSIATLIGLIFIIVAIAIATGILMAGLRIAYHKKSGTAPAQWKTKTLPMTSLILIVGLSALIFFMFAR